jgi:hypothetical protein
MRQLFPDGTIVNPEYQDFHPLKTLDIGEKGVTIYRFRAVGPHTSTEIEKLITHREHRFSTVSSLNDLHEGRPEISGSTTISKQEMKELRKSAAIALIASKEFSEVVMPHAQVMGEASFLTQQFLDRFIDKYFQSSEFKLISSGKLHKIEMSLESIRREVSVACFRDAEPSAHAWGVYGDSGRGICYEIEDRYVYKFFSMYTPKSITYSELRPSTELLDIAYLRIFIDLIKNWTLSDLSFRNQSHRFFSAMKRFILTKERSWENEKEVRVVRIGKQLGGYSEQSGLILKSLVFGPDAKESTICELSEPIRNLHANVTLFRARRAHGYAFDYEPI